VSNLLSSLPRSGVPNALCRTAAALLGGYLLTIAFTMATARGLQLAGWPRGEALLVAALPAFVVYLLAALRAFCATTAARAWAEQAGATLLLVALAFALQGLR
jgi:hypothetical protein